MNQIIKTEDGIDTKQESTNINNFVFEEIKLKEEFKSEWEDDYSMQINTLNDTESVDMENGSESDEEFIENCTSSEITALAASYESLHEKSKKTYEIAYNGFMEWKVKKNTNSFSEDNIVTYFTELAEKYKPSSLWTFYSMLKSTLIVHHNVNIQNYTKLRSFLKQQSDGYKAKKSAVFTFDQIREFINKAPDDKYLATKVALIMGVMGCCRAVELYVMKVDHIHDHNTAFLIDVPKTKNKAARQFSITGSFYTIVKKYINLRPSNATTKTFFLNFQRGKCFVGTIGINKFRSLGKQIATYLKLPHPEKYTGHCLRRSSATIFTNGGANTIDLKHDDVGQTIINNEGTKQLKPCFSNALTTTDFSASNSLNVNNNSNICSGASSSHINLNMNSTPSISFTNCNNFTVHFHSK